MDICAGCNRKRVIALTFYNREVCQQCWEQECDDGYLKKKFKINDEVVKQIVSVPKPESIQIVELEPTPELVFRDGMFDRLLAAIRNSKLMMEITNATGTGDR